jgi:hypothetical protein
MPTSRKILVPAAVALGCHFVALAFHSALASGVIEFPLVVLAAAACFEAAGRASGFARRFWRLVGIAFSPPRSRAMGLAWVWRWSTPW